MKINDAIFGAFFALVGAVVLVHVQSFPRIPGQQYGPGLFPGCIAAGFLICGVLLIVSGLRNRANEPWFAAGAWTRSRTHVIAALAVVAGVAAYILLSDALGFLILAPVLLFVWMVAFGVRWTTALLAAVVATLVIWYAFYKLLRVPLPWGVLVTYAF
jgi:putative tricarboxylic transport membrane protein